MKELEAQAQSLGRRPNQRLFQFLLDVLGTKSKRKKNTNEVRLYRRSDTNLLTAVDEFTIISCTSCSCISRTLECYDRHPFRAPLRVAYQETLFQRTYGLLEQFLRTVARGPVPFRWTWDNHALQRLFLRHLQGAC